MQCWFTSIEEITADITLKLCVRALAFGQTIPSAHRIGTDSVQTHLGFSRTWLIVAFLYPAWALVVRETAKVTTSGSKGAFITWTATIVRASMAASHWVTTGTWNLRMRICVSGAIHKIRGAHGDRGMLDLESHVSQGGGEGYHKRYRVTKLRGI
jgi:hypothetical protein